MQRLFQNRQIKNGYKDGGSAVHMFIFFVEICFFKLVGLCLNYFINKTKKCQRSGSGSGGGCGCWGLGFWGGGPSPLIHAKGRGRTDWDGCWSRGNWEVGYHLRCKRME